MGVRKRHSVPLLLSLPSLRDPGSLTSAQISGALHLLRDLFCPLQAFLGLDFGPSANQGASELDSGYVSADTDDCGDNDKTGATEIDFDCSVERDFAVRWLTNFIGRTDELAFFVHNDDEKYDGDDRGRFVDVACAILSYLVASNEDEQGDEDAGMTRRFKFDRRSDSGCARHRLVTVELYDTPMQTGRDHTDVGLQTWGASMVLSQKMCEAPEAFNLDRNQLKSSMRLIELGAGTGLVSLVLSALLSQVIADADAARSPTRIIATDYHPTVLENLKRNTKSHMQKNPGATPIEVCHLDWSAPRKQAPLDVPADIIVAADVAYAPEHAAWLCQCARQLLAPDGVFWLMVSIRPNGKFEGISDGVAAAFDSSQPADDGRVLKIVNTELVDKRDGIGRADEVGYKLHKVVWTRR